MPRPRLLLSNLVMLLIIIALVLALAVQRTREIELRAHFQFLIDTVTGAVTPRSSPKSIGVVAEPVESATGDAGTPELKDILAQVLAIQERVENLPDGPTKEKLRATLAEIWVNSGEVAPEVAYDD